MFKVKMTYQIFPDMGPHCTLVTLNETDKHELSTLSIYTVLHILQGLHSIHFDTEYLPTVSSILT